MHLWERYVDLLDNDDESDGVDAVGELPEFDPPGASGARQESSHGPWNWNSRLSTELQEVVESFGVAELYDLEFSVTIADPRQTDCPLVACSTGFTELTGYTVQEIVGRNCRFLLNGVPSNLVDDQTRMKCRAFCLACAHGEEYDGEADNLPEGVSRPWVDLPKGELICVQTNARKSGELFQNMFYMKQVELDDAMFILGLQAGLPEEFDKDLAMSDLEKKCQLAFSRLEGSMTLIEQVLAQQFWYSASMRRQI